MLHIDMSGVLAIKVLSAKLSHLISSVPLVALYLKIWRILICNHSWLWRQVAISRIILNLPGSEFPWVFLIS
jgi:hypothetical protein